MTNGTNGQTATRFCLKNNCIKIIITLIILTFTSIPKNVVTSSISKPQEIKEALSSHDRAIHVKDGWIRDPYIIKGPDGFFYLTGTIRSSAVKETILTKYKIIFSII